MQQHLGEEFDGYITGVTGFGFFVELEELFVEGLVHLSTLVDDLYTHAEKQHSLIGRRSRRVFRIGDKARVKVAAVSPTDRRIEFVLTGHTPSAPAAGPSAIVTPGEEFPRIPIKGKRISGLQRQSDNGGKNGSGAHARQGSGRKRR
jgi:ribonuclease R